MEALYGQQSTMSATDSNLHVAIEDLIHDYPDWQFPLLKRLNSKNFAKAVTSHKYEWSERDLRKTKTTVASATVSSAATTFYVTDPGVFNVDDVLMKPSGEQVIVESVSGGTLLTVKPWTGTPESMVLGNTVRRIGVASPQGKDADNMVITGPQDLYNYTQIFEDVIDLSGTEHEAMIRGDENQAKLVERKEKELMEMLQAALFVGQRAINKQDKRSTVGGLKYMIDTYAPNNAIDFGGSTTWNTDSAVKTKLASAVEKIADQMGNKPTIYMGYKAMANFAKIENDQIRSVKTDKTRGVGVVDTFRSLLGDLDVVMMRERTGVLDNLIFFVDEEAAGYKAMRNRAWFTKPLAITGDSHRWQILGEYTMKLDTPKVHSYLYNLGF